MQSITKKIWNGEREFTRRFAVFTPMEIVRLCALAENFQVITDSPLTYLLIFPNSRRIVLRQGTEWGLPNHFISLPYKLYYSLFPI